MNSPLKKLLDPSVEGAMGGIASCRAMRKKCWLQGKWANGGAYQKGYPTPMWKHSPCMKWGTL